MTACWVRYLQINSLWISLHMAFWIEAQKSKEYDKTITYVTSIDIVEKTIIDRVYVK